MTSLSRGALARRLISVCACLLAAACAGGGTDAGGLQVKVRFTGAGDGQWVGGSGSALLFCHPQMTVSAEGAGRAVWTGGTSRLTAPYGTYDLTFTAAEVAAMVGGADVSAGQSRSNTFNQTAYTSFHLQVNFAYTVEGTGTTGTATGAFDCKAPA